MSGTIRVIDLPDLGTVTDASSIVADKTGTGRFSALAIKNYCFTASIPEAPSNNTPYGRMNGAWTPVLGDAPNNNTPYARMNLAWAVVVPEAPLTGSVYGRGSYAWTPVLPITGGNISGSLGTSGDINVGGVVNANQFRLSSAIGYQWFFYATDGAGNHVQQHAANWYDAWIVATGMRLWVGGGTNLMTLDSSGNLVVNGNIGGGAATSISVPGNITGGTAVWNVPGAFGFAPYSTSWRRFYFGAQYYWEWNTTDGSLTWISNGTPMWNMRATDGLTFNSVAAVGGVGPYLNTSDRGTKTGITPTTKGLAEVLQLNPMSFVRDYPGAPAGGPEEIGFIAQDVQPVVPEAVWQAGMVMTRDGEPALALSESTLTALNVNAIKELNDMIATLTARVAALETP